MPYSNPDQAKAILISIKRRRGEAAAKRFANEHLRGNMGHSKPKSAAKRPHIQEDSPFFMPKRDGNRRGPYLTPPSELAGRALKATDAPPYKGRVVTTRNKKGEKIVTHFGSANFMKHPRMPRGH